MKKIAVVLIALALLLTPLASLTAQAWQEETFTEGEWTYLPVDGGINICGYGGSDTDVTVPAKVAGKKVVEVGLGSFSSNGDIVSVTLADGIKRIGEGAFKNCKALVSVAMPKTLEYIGELAFYNCTSYYDVQIPDSVTVVEDRAFEGTGYYNDVSHRENDILYCGDCLIEAFAIGESCEIKKGTRVICTGAFYNKRDLKTVTLPDSLEYINRDAFMYCPLESLTIPANVKKIYKYAFSDCAKLKSVTFAKNSKLTAIESGAFSHCTSLKAIKLPDSVKSIGGGAFSGCSQLSDISFPKAIEFIGANAFYETGAYGNKNNWSDRMFYLCDCLLDTDKNLNRSSFTVREGTVYIGENVFVRAEYFTEIHIPASVKRIDVNAFYLQYKIKTVYYGGTEEQWKTVGKESVDFLKNVKIVCEAGPDAKHEHTFGEWELKREATCKERGKMQRVCTECGQKDVKYIAKTDHVYENGVCVYCGKAQEGYVEPVSEEVSEESSEEISEESLEESSEEISEESSEAISEEVSAEVSEAGSEEIAVSEEESSEEEEISEEISEYEESSEEEPEKSEVSQERESASSAEEAPDRSEAGSASGSESSVAESGEEKPGAIVYIVIGACVAAVIAAGAVLLIHKRK